MVKYEELAKKLTQKELAVVNYYIMRGEHTFTQLIIGTFFIVSLAGTAWSLGETRLYLIGLICMVTFSAIWYYYQIYYLTKFCRFRKQMRKKYELD